MQVRREKTSWAILLAVAGALTILVSCLVLMRVWGIGIRGEWVWSYYERPASWHLVALPAVLAIIIGTAAAYGMRPLKPLLTVVFLCGMVGASYAMQQSLSDMSPAGPDEAVGVTVFPWVGGYYSESLSVTNMGEYLRSYADRIRAININDPLWGHLADHPPGAIVTHWAINRLMGDNEAGVAVSIWLWRMLACLTIVPVYLLGRAAWSHRAAIAAAAFCAVIPALNLFGPYPDQVLPLLAMSSLYFFWRASNGGSAWWATACGFTLFVGMQFTLAMVVIPALMAIAIVLMLLRRQSDLRRISAAGLSLGAVAFAAGLLLPAIALKLSLDYDVLEVWRVCVAKHASFSQYFTRTYWKWALFDPAEMALFMGAPLACLTAWACLSARTRLSNAALLTWSFVGILALLSVSGMNRGEVGRLWMFLMPLGALAAAAEVDERPWPTLSFALLFALMTFQLVCFRASLNVFGTLGG